jgi:hypothetical protein
VGGGEPNRRAFAKRGASATHAVEERSMLMGDSARVMERFGQGELGTAWATAMACAALSTEPASVEMIDTVLSPHLKRL